MPRTLGGWNGGDLSDNLCPEVPPLGQASSRCYRRSLLWGLNGGVYWSCWCEALAGAIGKVLDDDVIEILVDRNNLLGTVNLIGHGEEIWGAEQGTKVLAERGMRPDLEADTELPDDTRLWAALQAVGGGTWGGCVYDVNAIVEALQKR